MRNKNFIVGLFVSIGLLAFVLTTIWLTGRSGTQATKNYSLYFSSGVSGLMLGGPVYYLGVKIGSVTAMTIVPGDPMQVRVDIKVFTSVPIDSGTYGSLVLQGITGVAVVSLSSDPGRHKPLQTHKAHEYPVIATRDTGIGALLSKAPDVVSKLDKVLEEINLLLGQENRQYVNNVLKNLSNVADVIATKQEVIGEIPEQLKLTLVEIRDSLQQLDSLTGQIQPGLVSALANIDRASQNLEQLTQRVAVWSRENDAEMDDFFHAGLGQVPALVSEARKTLREIKKLVKDLRADPSILIYQPAQETVNPQQERDHE